MRPVWLERGEGRGEVGGDEFTQTTGWQEHITWILLGGGGSGKPGQHLIKGVECSVYAFTRIALAAL